MHTLKIEEERGKEGGCIHSGGGDDNVFAFSRSDSIELAKERIRGSNHFLRVVIEEETCLGQNDLSTLPHKDRPPDQFSEVPDLGADSGLCEV
jgi:hypothetical protein